MLIKNWRIFKNFLPIFPTDKPYSNNSNNKIKKENDGKKEKKESGSCLACFRIHTVLYLIHFICSLTLYMYMYFCTRSHLPIQGKAV